MKKKLLGKSRAALPRCRAGEVLKPKDLWGKLEDRFRYVAASLFGLLALFFLIGLPVLLLLTSTYGLGEGVRKKAEETLGGQFYKVTLARVLFNPFKGFTLEQMEIHDRTASQRLVVSADRLSVSINLESLVRSQIRLERISLRDATLDIPLGPTEEPRLRLDHVSGLILSPPEQFRITSASFDVAGISVQISGTFQNPKQFSPKPISSHGPGNIALTLNTIQKELKSVRWETHHPKLTIQASGDLSDTESLRVESAILQTKEGSWHRVHLPETSLSLHYASRKLTIERAVFDDGMGILQAEGFADFATHKASLEFSGAFNAGIFPAIFLNKEKAADWSWEDPLRLNGNFSAGWGGGTPVLEGTALLESGRFCYRGVAIDGLSAGVALRDGKVLVRDFHLAGDLGSVDANLLIAPSDNRLRFNAALYPEKLAPAVSGKIAESLASMDFKEPLNISFDGNSVTPDPLLMRGKGGVDFKKASMRGADIETMSSSFQMADGAVSFLDIIVRMGEGMGRGKFIYDFKNWEGRFPEVRSTLDPVKLMTWIDPRIAESLKDYRFRKPPELRLTGKVGLHNPEKNDLHILINAPDGLNYTLLKKDLPFGATSGNVLLKGQTVFVDLPSSRLFGGGIALKADASVAPGDSRYGAAVHLEKVNFETLTKTYFGYEGSKGQITADYAFRDLGGHEKAMVGQGNLLIQNGNVLAMPVMGPLSALLNDIIPGMGYQPAHKASANFTLENGVINTSNLLIEGTGFSMIGHGDIYYLDDRMNMSIRLNAKGLPGLLLFPVSKIFEYESVGSAKNPKWRPKILPKGASTSKSLSEN